MGSILGLEFHKNSCPEGFFVELSLDVSRVTTPLSSVSPNSMELFRLWQIRRKSVEKCRRRERIPGIFFLEPQKWAWKSFSQLFQAWSILGGHWHCCSPSQYFNFPGIFYPWECLEEPGNAGKALWDFSLLPIPNFHHLFFGIRWKIGASGDFFWLSKGFWDLRATKIWGMWDLERREQSETLGLWSGFGQLGFLGKEVGKKEEKWALGIFRENSWGFPPSFLWELEK